VNSAIKEREMLESRKDRGSRRSPWSRKDESVVKADLQRSATVPPIEPLTLRAPSSTMGV